MIFLKSTRAPIATGVFQVDIAAKPPGKTFSFFAAVDGDDPPNDFIGKIEALGFRKVQATPYTHQDGKKVIDLQFHKTGTDIFEGWTDAERQSNLAALDALLSGYNIKVTPRVMTLAEAFN